MTTYGLTDDGFVIKTYEDIISETEASLKAALGDELNLTANSVMGQINAIFCLKLAESWQVLQALYNAFDADLASGDSLDRMGLLTGTPRLLPTKSTVTATVELDNGTTLPAGSIASVAGNPVARFVTLAEVVNDTGITDDFDVDMEAESTGVVVANAGTLTVIETPVSGWNAISNQADADLGTDLETDAAYRLRRIQELAGLGTSPVDAIRANLLALDDVSSVTVFENSTDATDGDGLPPHSIECLVNGGTAQEIIDEIWASKAGGIATYGSSSGTATDTAGTAHTVYYTRPTVIDIYIDVILTKIAATYPADGEAQIQEALVTYGEANLNVGDDVIITALYAPIYSVSGVADVTSLYVYDNTSLGSESLSQIDFSSTTDWSVAGDASFSGNAVHYTHSGGTGSLTQTVADMAIAPSNTRWYAFTYTVSGSTGSCSASITTSLARESTALTLTNGTHTTYVYTAASASNFVIGMTSTSGGFVLDDVSLKVLNRSTSNYTVGVREIADLESTRIRVVAS